LVVAILVMAAVLTVASGGAADARNEKVVILTPTVVVTKTLTPVVVVTKTLTPVTPKTLTPVPASTHVLTPQTPHTLTPVTSTPVP
jgi:hypothetical protein